MLPSQRNGWGVLLLPIALTIVLACSPRGITSLPATNGQPSTSRTSPVPSPSGQFQEPPQESRTGEPTPEAAVPANPAVPNAVNSSSSSENPASRSGAVPATNVLGTTPGATDARFAKVDRYLADGEVDQAETLLKQILADPNHEIAAHATFVLGRTYLSNGDTSSAQTTLNQYVSANPTGPDTAAAEFALARLSDQKGASADAAKHYRRYLDLTKDHALDSYADYTLAEIARSTGDTSTAVKLYRQAITAGIPTSLEFQAAGYVASKLGRPADVEAWYASLSDRPGLDPTTRMHYVLLQADLLKQAGQASQVQALYQKI